MAAVTTELKVVVKAAGQQDITKLDAALNKLAVTARTKVDTNFKKVASQLKDVQKTSKNSIQNLRDYRNAWRDISAQLEIGSKEFKEARLEAEKLDRQLQKAESRKPQGSRVGRLARGAGAIAAGGVFGGVEGAIGGAIGLGFGGPAGAAVGAALGAQLGGIRQAAGATAEYAANLQRLRIALFGVTESQEQFQNSLKFIAQTTKNFAIPQDVVTRQFTRLQASVQGAGGSIEDTKTAFNGIVAAVRATGGSLSDVDAALTATAQVFSKGKVSAEELRQQIGERLPGAFTLFAESIGLTPQELDKALEKGQVSLQDFQTFAEALFNRYGETAKEIADGPESAGDRLKVVLQELNESIGTLLQPIGAAFQETFAGIVKSINEAIRGLNLFFGLGEEGLKRRLRNIDLKLEQLPAGDVTPQAAGRAGVVDFLAARTRLLQERQQVEEELRKLQEFDVKQAQAGSGLPGIIPDDPTVGTRGPDPMVALRREASEAFRDLNAKFRNAARITLSESLKDITIEIVKAQEQGNKIAIFQLKQQRELLPLRVKELALQKEIEGFEKLIIQTKEKGVSTATQERALATSRANLLQTQNELQARQAAARQEYAEFEKQNLADQLKLADERNAKIAEYQELLQQQARIENPFAGFKAGIDSFTDSLGSAFDATKKFAEVGLGGITGAIEELVTNGSLNFKEFAANLLRDLAKVLIRGVAVQSVLKLIGFGSATPISGSQGLGVGYDLGSFFANKLANGGIMTKKGQLDLKRYARGGIANSPQVALFGEGSMPEAYVPLPDGRSIPVTMQGGGNRVNVGSVNITVENTGEDLQPAAQKQLAGQVRGLVLSTLADERRSGGILR